MAGTRQTKRERQREAAEARAAARKRQQQRKTLGYVVGGLALIAAVVLIVLATMSGEEARGVGPSEPGQITAGGPARTEPLAAGEAVPDFSAPGIDGGTVSWADFAGAPAVVSIWAPWCSHCQAELPVLDRVMRDYPDVGFVSVVTSIGDQPGPAPDVFMEREGLSFPTAVDDASGTLAVAFGIQGFPTIYFVGSDGTVVQMAEGEVEEETLRLIVGSLS